MDKYDVQIAELTADPDEIDRNWGAGIGLFQFATLSGDIIFNGSSNSGCLTMIRERADCFVVINDSVNNELTKQIKADERIPKSSNDITVESLPVFAEWQRKLDIYRNKAETNS